MGSCHLLIYIISSATVIHASQFPQTPVLDIVLKIIRKIAVVIWWLNILAGGITGGGGDGRFSYGRVRNRRVEPDVFRGRRTKSERANENGSNDDNTGWSKWRRITEVHSFTINTYAPLGNIGQQGSPIKNIDA